VTPDGTRQAVVHLCEVNGVSKRWACDVLSVDRSSIRYQSKRVDNEGERNAIKRISRERRRFGYRRINIMLRREKIVMNHKKLRRICAEEIRVPFGTIGRQVWVFEDRSMRIECGL
jgi:putative transposase